MNSEELKGLFEEILGKEDMMLKLYGRILGEFTNEEIKDKLKEIMKDEGIHRVNAKHMVQILDE
ncbi:MAG: hypothetical protein ABIH52_01070 [Candidatus Aenigmatarchaeota archaeon]|nr:hypothetical protein [Nanoarchaeota archaeon]